MCISSIIAALKGTIDLFGNFKDKKALPVFSYADFEIIHYSKFSYTTLVLFLV